jgi:hypothetical protein
MAETEIRKIAENYVKTQIRSWNGRSSKISKRDIQKAIAKVAKALQEAREASAKTVGK